MEWKELLCGERLRKSAKPKSDTDYRSEFEKDYHRIIGSASFRRLQDKTQVFPLDKNDFVRTRLTHSLEVSSIAKSLGQSIGKILSEKKIISESEAGAMADILLCAGLLHDIGNPPFGHFGECVIREWFEKALNSLEYKKKPLASYLTEQQIKDLCNFEGNAQSLRVVSRLHHLVDDKGMNLTKALMNSIIKYPVSSVEIDKAAGDIRLKKMGYFAADRAIFESIVSATGAGDKRYPLVYLLEAADDIAYSTADIEDGVKKGIISYNKLLYLLSNNSYRNLYGEGVNNKSEYKDMVYSVDRLKGLYEKALENNEADPEIYAVQNWAVSMQSVMIQSVISAFIEHYDEIMEGNYKKDLFYGTHSEVLIKVLKQTAYENIFQSSGIIKLEVAAEGILRFLLEQFVGAAVNYKTGEYMTEKQGKLMQLVSPNYLNVYEKEAAHKTEGEALYLRLLLVTDFIAGMTDNYAKTLYQEFTGNFVLNN